MSMSHLPKDIVAKSHNGVLGNEDADALALQAAKTPDTAGTSFNQAEKLYFYLYWLATPIKRPGSMTEELGALSNLQDKTKQKNRAGLLEVDTMRRRVRASRGMANKPPDPHQFCHFPSPRLVLASVVLRDFW
eukprot:1144684-Pelagomonas_calceolata.AAC.1